MPKCPDCGKDITTLNIVRIEYVLATGTLQKSPDGKCQEDISNRRTLGMIEASNNFYKDPCDRYHCPRCSVLLFDTLYEALSFLGVKKMPNGMYIKPFDEDEYKSRGEEDYDEDDDNDNDE